MVPRRPCLPSRRRATNPTDACVHRSLRWLQRPNLGRLEQSKRREADLFAMRPREFFGKPVRDSFCPRIADLPTPTMPAFIVRCVRCNAQIWVALNSPSDVRRICSRCAARVFRETCEGQLMSAFGSKADICAATSHVRFTPNSDRESGFPQTVMSALAPKADMCGARGHVCFGP